jgi:hypothetical protein
MDLTLQLEVDQKSGVGTPWHPAFNIDLSSPKKLEGGIIGHRV